MNTIYYHYYVISEWGKKKKKTILHMDQIEEENKHMGHHPWSKLYEDIGFRV
jgi:hypothetical protein